MKKLRRHLHPPPRKWWRGTALRGSAVEGARTASKILSTKTRRRVRRPLHHASRGPPPPLARGRKDKPVSFSRCAFLFAPRGLPTMSTNGPPNNQRGGGAPKDAEGRYRGSRQQAELACLKRSSRRAPLLADALASRRSTAVLARFLGLAQSGPALHGSDDMRYPGSQLLADLRRGRPGEFPNRPNTVCETAPGHRTRSTFRIASGMCPSMSELLLF